ncbi:Crp/Fnr family transcriptional regulator [Acuticoccus sp. I52.16.1]|uniref:Crp/Fnr family transcriptional regulator n=1 Tax=Acuticoccus sp. I52.16.1 TaxID=2928472 RepID=UPI001FD60832|nr:Crp/Fnr family transcriptional regulator [Acuticoccus sp. I52.16.1]UOM34037.1 Crp/Fnr family transcriptional regulator [Acuticoccus sp. I52.16.1]
MSLDITGLPPQCRQCGVRNGALCGVLTPDELGALNASSRHRQFFEGQTIVIEGEPAIVGNILSGVCIEKKSLPDGREQIVSILFPADFVSGDLDGVSDTTVQAVSDVRLCMHDRANFQKLLEEHQGLQMAYLGHARQELSNAREWMLLLGQKTAEERVATFLLRLATRYTEAGCRHYPIQEARDGMVFDIPITRAQIAAHIGLTIETVSRKLRGLCDQAAIDLVGTRTVKLKNVARLRSVAN